MCNMVGHRGGGDILKFYIAEDGFIIIVEYLTIIRRKRVDYRGIFAETKSR
jgi:hypothetical protein